MRANERAYSEVERAERFALEHHLGEQSFSELQTAMTDAGFLPAKNRYTTQTAIERELDTIAIMESGQGQVKRSPTMPKVWQLLRQELSLTEGQRQAIEMTATTPRPIHRMAGRSGSG